MGGRWGGGGGGGVGVLKTKTLGAVFPFGKGRLGSRFKFIWGGLKVICNGMFSGEGGYKWRVVIFGMCRTCECKKLAKTYMQGI